MDFHAGFGVEVTTHVLKGSKPCEGSEVSNDPVASVAATVAREASRRTRKSRSAKPQNEPGEQDVTNGNKNYKNKLGSRKLFLGTDSEACELLRTKTKEMERELKERRLKEATLAYVVSPETCKKLDEIRYPCLPSEDSSFVFRGVKTWKGVALNRSLRKLEINDIPFVLKSISSSLTTKARSADKAYRKTRKVSLSEDMRVLQRELDYCMVGWQTDENKFERLCDFLVKIFDDGKLANPYIKPNYSIPRHYFVKEDIRVRPIPINPELFEQGILNR